MISANRLDAFARPKEVSLGETRMPGGVGVEERIPRLPDWDTLFNVIKKQRYRVSNRPIFCSTSDIIFGGKEPINSAFLVRQSKLFTWSERMAPVTDRPGGTTTSKGYPLIWFVIGQKRASPTFSLYGCGDSTTAGLRPACSCPA